MCILHWDTGTNFRDQRWNVLVYIFGALEGLCVTGLVFTTALLENGENSGDFGV